MADNKEKELEKTTQTTEDSTNEEDVVTAANGSSTEEAMAGEQEEAIESEDTEAPVSEDSDSDVPEKNPEAKKGFFKKKKDKKDTMIEELTDKLKRQMAEFENFRKRTEKEKAGMYEIGAKSVVEKMLPIVDNFERGLAGVEEDQKEDPFIEGMEKIYKQIISVFEELEVKPIEALEQEFNPDLHNAVMHVEDETVGENVIVEEFQKGYTYRDSVVRHSMVKVAN